MDLLVIPKPGTKRMVLKLKKRYELYQGYAVPDNLSLQSINESRYDCQILRNDKVDG
jgi:hypothetical protein